ncbi:MAG: helix-turn-helix domain-containing protein, partial [Clostridiales bacterium]|nr:helix-turn-helix domain-containing protein [Clostridiales bacterium]
MKNDVREIINYSTLSGISITYENAPSSYPAHWHSAAEFTAVLKDNFRYKIGDTDIKAMKGDIILCWPREIHQVVAVPKNGSMFIQFSPDLLENNLDLISISRLMNRCHLIRAKEEPELSKAIFEKISNIRDIFMSSDTLRETRCKLITYEIILLIGEYVIRQKREQFGTDDMGDQAWTYIRTICSYIAEHSSEDIDETDVASAAGLSRHYFSRLFKKYMQTSFPNYLSTVRIRTAIRLLSDEDLSITECAFKSGFQSTTTFN